MQKKRRPQMLQSSHWRGPQRREREKDERDTTEVLIPFGYGKQKPIFQPAVECWNCGQYGHKSFECRSNWNRRHGWDSYGSYSSRPGGQSGLMAESKMGTWSTSTWLGSRRLGKIYRLRFSCSSAGTREPTKIDAGEPMPQVLQHPCLTQGRRDRQRAHSRSQCDHRSSPRSTARSMASHTSSELLLMGR